jgi:uncharacterized membrane protein YbhN (UPF0104 family)
MALKRQLKPVLGVLVLLITVTVFVVYIAHHPEVWHQLRQVKLVTLLTLLALYAVFVVTLAAIQAATLALCDTSLSRKENFLLTIYSSIINFFGPLQSGPGFRAVYLKKRHGTKLKNYTLATLLYYGFFALFSGLFLLSGLIGIWGVLGLFVLAVICMWVALKIPHPFIRKLHTLQLQRVGWLAAATLAQVVMVVIIYFTELHSINPHIHFSQAVIYTGAANFALFVSLTPGAIGFRESFLLFSRDLHHIGASTIATASLIDRAVYIILLGILFVIMLAVHAKTFLAKAPAASPPTDAK